MLIPINDKQYITGPLDVALIAVDSRTGRFHMMLFEEKPMPGERVAPEDCATVRLKSKLHHAQGVETLEEARAYLAEFREKVIIEDGNVIEEPVAMDGVGPMMILARNWFRDGRITAAHIGATPPAAEPAEETSAAPGP